MIWAKNYFCPLQHF